MHACICGTPLLDQRPSAIASNPRVPAKLYCSPRCVRRAAYLRRKERRASLPIAVENPVAVGEDGWPVSP